MSWIVLKVGWLIGFESLADCSLFWNVLKVWLIGLLQIANRYWFYGLACGRLHYCDYLYWAVLNYEIATVRLWIPKNGISFKRWLISEVLINRLTLSLITHFFLLFSDSFFFVCCKLFNCCITSDNWEFSFSWAFIVFTEGAAPDCDTISWCSYHFSTASAYVAIPESSNFDLAIGADPVNLVLRNTITWASSQFSIILITRSRSKKNSVNWGSLAIEWWNDA